MYLIYFLTIAMISIFLMMFFIYKDYIGIATGCFVLTFIFFGVSLGMGIGLIANRVSADKKEQELNDLKIKAEYFIESENNISLEEEVYQKLLIESIDNYNNKLGYCRSQQESKLYGEFMNWEFCYDYEPIEYSIAVKDITIK